MKTYEHYPIVINGRIIGETAGEDVSVLDDVACGMRHREYGGEWCEVRFPDGRLALIPAAAINPHTAP